MLRLPDVTDSSLKRTYYTGIHRPDDHERFEFQQKLCELELVINPSTFTPNSERRLRD